MHFYHLAITTRFRSRLQPQAKTIRAMFATARPPNAARTAIASRHFQAARARSPPGPRTRFP